MGQAATPDTSAEVIVANLCRQHGLTTETLMDGLREVGRALFQFGQVLLDGLQVAAQVERDRAHAEGRRPHP
jgi:hypothetical protein